jgi:hypothetical protein
MVYTVDDSTSGNNNRVLERGETIHLRSGVRNFSIGGTSTASLQLSSSSADLEILNGTSTPAFFATDTTMLFDFTLKVTQDAPPELADIVLALETARGYSCRHLTSPVEITDCP